MRRRLAVGVAALVTLAGGVAIAARTAAHRYTFPTAEVPIAAAPDDLVATTCTARDGAMVRMLETRALATRPRVVVYFHNNRETIEARADLARSLDAKGLGAVLVEYRGYGRSPGEPSEDALYDDAEAALDALAARGIAKERIVLWGTSLGTGVAAEMARRGKGTRLVLVAPYTSIPDLVTEKAPFVPARALVADRFDTGAKAPEIALPTLVIHGDEDEIVPFSMGETLARTIAGATLVRVRGGRHGDLFAREGGRLYDAVAALSR